MINIQKILDYFYLVKHGIKEQLGDLLNLFYLRVYLIIILGFNLLNWLLVYIISINIIDKDAVILHYNVDFGIDLIGGVKRIYIIPALGFLIVFFNVVLLSIIYRKKIHGGEAGADKFSANLLLAGALAANLLLLLSVISIYLINFFK